jgi:hypothetical protein
VKEKKKKYRRELYTWYIYIFFCYLAETPQEQQQQSLIGVERLANAIHFALRFLYLFFFFLVFGCWQHKTPYVIIIIIKGTRLCWASVCVESSSRLINSQSTAMRSRASLFAPTAVPT